MITPTEIRFIRDILHDLKELADPSEYLEDEVSEVFRILDSLEMYDTSLICDVVDEINKLEHKEQRDE